MPEAPRGEVLAESAAGRWLARRWRWNVSWKDVLDSPGRSPRNVVSPYDSRPRVVDLFAGAGFFSSAFKAERFRVVAAVEMDRLAASTYALNVGAHVLRADVREVEPLGPCDVLIAGPPCQGFSTLGKRDPADPRNFLGLEVLRWSRELRPAIVVVENVPGFLKSSSWELLAAGLRSQGYSVEASVVDAVDFGVPQYRRRSFTFAARGRLPEPVRAARRGTSVRSAWKGLAPAPDGVNQHVAPAPSPIALARMRVIPPGGDKRDVMGTAPELCPPSWWRTRSEITDVWGRMEWDKPANTLRTALLNASKGRYIHPDQHRVISLREAARLQTVPDRWMFCGEPYPVARQIGNGVPPLLGRAIARAVLLAL